MIRSNQALQPRLCGAYRRPYGKPVTGRTWWPKLPDGTYHVTELINPRDLGEQPAERLRTEGLSVTLQPHEVAIFRMELKR